MNALRLISMALAVSCGTPLLAAAQSGATEVFPVTKGLHCAYWYQVDYDYAFMGTYYHWGDSGLVEYSVLDSTRSGDTLILWTVFQKQNTLHRYQDWRTDTSYVLEDSTVFTMTESLAGAHAYGARSLIWNFPATNLSHDTLRVYRYAETSSVTLGNSYLCVSIVGPFFDTLWVRADSGLVGRKWSLCTPLDDMFSITETGECALIARTITSVEEDQPLPHDLRLLQNYPNPFNPVTKISYSLPKACYVRLKVYNVLGEEVASLVEEFKQPGSWSAEFDGSKLASGMYFYQLMAGEFVGVKKMMLEK